MILGMFSFSKPVMKYESEKYEGYIIVALRFQMTINSRKEIEEYKRGNAEESWHSKTACLSVQVSHRIKTMAALRKVSKFKYLPST